MEVAGGKLSRVDIHGKDEAVVTEFYGTSPIDCLRPVSEEIARDPGGDGDIRPARPVACRERPQLPPPGDEAGPGQPDL